MNLPKPIMRSVVRFGIKPLMLSWVPISVQRMGLDSTIMIQRKVKGVSVEKDMIADVPVEWHRPQSRDKDKVIVYLHGGKFVIGSPTSHREMVSTLAKNTGCAIVFVHYRRAPEYIFPAAVNDARSVFMALRQKGYAAENIAIAGDSAGGGLSFSLLHSLRNDKQAMPAAAFTMSPWVDLSCTSDTLKSHAKRDPMLNPKGLKAATEKYLSGLEAETPLASPLFGEMNDLPPTLIHVGSEEVLLDDSKKLHAKLQSESNDTQLKVWDGLWHVFQFHVGMLSASRESIKEGAEFLRKHLNIQD